LVSLGFALTTCVIVLACAPVLTDDSALATRSTTIELQIAPETLLLSSYQGGEVGAHTNIRYSDVDRSTVALEGFEALRTKADATGNFVAFFDEEAIKGIVPEGAQELRLQLTGSTVSGDDFVGTDTVQVMQ
jgi:hypothetical protein